MRDYCLSTKYYYNGVYHEELGTSHLFRLATKVSDNGDICIDMHTSCDITDLIIEITLPIVSNDNTLFYANGYQSESPSNEYFKSDSMPRESKLIKHFMNAFGWSYKSADFGDKIAKTGEFYGYNLCYFRQNFSDFIHLYASLDEKSAYTRFHADMTKGNITISRDFTGKTINSSTKVMDICSLTGEYNKVFDRYFNTLLHLSNNSPLEANTPPLESNISPLESNISPLESNISPIESITSDNVMVDNISDTQNSIWGDSFSYFNTYPLHQSLIHERLIMSEYNAIKSRYHKYTTLLIEEGYCLCHTDWCHIDSNKFPNGIKSFVARLHQQGKKAGIWLAPLLVYPKSSIATNHPDWLIRKDDNPIVMSPDWGGAYALDTTIDSVREYIKQVLTTIAYGWGFDVIKVDSLYIAGAIPRSGMTRSELDSDIVDLIRDTLEGKLMIVSGSTLPSLYFKADYVNIAPALTNYWDNIISKLATVEYPTSKNCITTLLTRRYLRDRAFKIDTMDHRTSKHVLSRTSNTCNMIISQLTNSKSISQNISTITKAELNKLDNIQSKTDVTDIMINYIEDKNIRIDYISGRSNKKFILNVDNPKLSHS